MYDLAAARVTTWLLGTEPKSECQQDFASPFKLCEREQAESTSRPHNRQDQLALTAMYVRKW